MMPTSSGSSSRCGDGDGGDDEGRDGTKELRWTTALGEAINQKKGEKQTHFRGSRPHDLIGDS
jgi:hypothetical protein